MFMIKSSTLLKLIFTLLIICTTSVNTIFSQCTYIYVSSSGSALGDGTITNPYDLQTGLSQSCAQNKKHVRLLAGTYTVNSKLQIGCNDLTIDGDWQIVGTEGYKNSSLVTTVNINSSLETASYDGAAGTTVGYYIGIESIGRSAIFIGDITFNVKNGGASGLASGTTGNRGNSIYGFYFRNTTNYYLERCVMNTGSASQGLIGTNGVAGLNGSVGGNGTNGDCQDDCVTNNSSAGGIGGGSGSGAGGAGKIDASCGSTSALGDNGNVGGNATNPRAGGGGGSAGTGGSENNRGGNGGNGGNGGGGALGATAGGGGSTSGNGSTGTAVCGTVNGFAGTNGSNGNVGSNGSAAPISATYNFYWLPTGQSASGLDGTGGGGGKGGGGGGGQGCFFCTDGTGSAGGSGGGGGQGGQGGTGAWGSGGTFALYLYNSTGQSGTTTLNNASATLGSNGGNGGVGGAGGNGGFAGAIAGGCPTCEVGTGGNGGNGGAGGAGGTGGNGAAGVSTQISSQSGSSNLIASSSSITQIFTSNAFQGCTNSEIIITKDNGNWDVATPFIEDLNTGVSSFTPSSNTASISYSTIGWKDLIGSTGTYKNFISITTNRAASVFDPSMVTSLCEGDTFEMSTPTTGTQYEWVIFSTLNNAQTPESIFTTQNASWTPPVTGSNVNYKVRLRVYENCCGWSTPVYFSFSVLVNPIVDILSNSTNCDAYILQPLTTGNYYTLANGSGSTLNSGDSITTSQTIYIYSINGVCSDESSFSISIDQPIVVDSLVDTTTCDFFSLQPLNSGVYYTATNGGGTLLNAGDQINSSQMIYIYGSNGTCVDQSSFSVQIDQSVVLNYQDEMFACDSFELLILAEGNYYTEANANGVMLNSGDILSSSQLVYIYATNGVCVSQDSIQITIDTIIAADSPTDVISCLSYVLPSLTSGDYYTGSNAGGLLLNVGDIVSSNQTIFVYKENGLCFDENSFIITLDSPIDADIRTDVVVCDEYQLLPLSPNNAYFTATNGGGSLLNSGDLITTSQTVYIYATNGTCTDENQFDVTINQTPDNTVSLNSFTLSAIASANSYQWVDCNNGNSPIAGATSQSFLPTIDGSYAVILTQDNCEIISACTNVSGLSVFENSFASLVTVHPNPTDKQITISFGEEQEKIYLVVTDATGKVISSDLHTSVSNIEYNIEAESGVYFIQLTTEKGNTTVIKAIKN